MNELSKIIDIIYESIDEINEDRDASEKIQKSGDTVLLGQEGVLDSFGLVSLIVATEQNIEEKFGVTLVLANEKAMSQRNSPFRTVASFAEYIHTTLKEKANG